MRRFVMASLLLATVAGALPAAAADWTFNADASFSAFRDFQRRLATAAYDYPRHGAAPLGLLGFEVWADATYDRQTHDEGFAREAVSGELPAGVLSIARVGVRKGLPGRVDLGVSYGTAVKSDVRLLSADVQWSMLKGGLLSPALALRLTGTKTTGGNSPYDLEQEGAELVLSKGFPLFTPYVGAGIVTSKGTLDRFESGTYRDRDTRPILYGGVRLNLLVPKITVEVEKADVVQAAVRVGFGI
jgi:hypothetical protein